MNLTDATSVINKLRNLFSVFGLPDVVVSDNGPPFSSFEFSNYMKSNGIKHLFSAPHHPQSNGLAENCVRILKSALKKAHLENQNLNIFLDRFLFDYRTTEHMTTGKSPAYLMFNRNIKTRFDLIRPSFNNHNQEKIQKQIENFKGKESRNFEIGEPVIVSDFSSHGTGKWIPGKVCEKFGNVTFDVKVGEDRVVRRHSNQIRKRKSLDYPETTEPDNENISESCNSEIDKSLLFSHKSDQENIVDKKLEDSPNTIVSNSDSANSDKNTLVQETEATDSLTGKSRYFFRDRK